MSRNILVCGLLVTGLAFAGCSSSSKSGTAGDGSLASSDVAGRTASGDVPGGGTGGDAGAGSSGTSDGKTETDGSVRTGDGSSGGDVKPGQPGDLAGGTGGIGGGDGGPSLPRDARDAPDQAQPQKLLDGGPAVLDAPMGEDLAPQADGVAVADVRPTPDGLSDSSRRDGPKDTGYCNLPDYGLSMPADQKEIAEKYGLCQYSDGTAYTEVYGDTVVRGTVLQLSEAKLCVDSSDPQKGKTTGSSYRFVLGSHGYSGPDIIRTNTSVTQRLYALKVAADGTEIRAAYDLVSSTLPGNIAPDYPKRYARLDLVCGDASSFPEFDGWTGRITQHGYSRLDNPSRIRYFYYFVGSAKGESGDRMFYFQTDVLD